MKLLRYAFLFLCLMMLLEGCCRNIKSAINSYAVSAEKQATVMKINLDNCLKSNDPSKYSTCKALYDNIETYRQAARNLQTTQGQ